MLSHSTVGSAKHDDVTKVVEATAIAKRDYPDTLICGELQLDAAIVPEVAASKDPEVKWQEKPMYSSSRIWMQEISDTSWFSAWLKQKHTAR